MFISISTRNCSVAIGKAIEAAQERLASDKVKFSEQSYDALRGGAEHNGMKIDAAREQEMRDMVARDIEHALEQHPVKQTLQVLELLERMLKRNDDPDTVVIDDADFSMLEEFLPPL